MSRQGAKMRERIVILMMIGILTAGFSSLKAAVPIEGMEYSIVETAFSAQLDTPLARLDLIPAYGPAPVAVMNLDPRNAVLGPARSSLSPKIGTRSFGDVMFEASAVSLVALNIADYLSTREALKYRGLQEGNPLMKNVVKDPAGFAALKIGVAAASYISMKSLYKKNKALAWVVSTASNALMSYVVSNNIRLVHQARASRP
jgi:hypothetical protein